MDYIELMANFGHPPEWAVPANIRDQVVASGAVADSGRYYAAIYGRTIDAAPGHRGSAWLEIAGLTADLEADIAAVNADWDKTDIGWAKAAARTARDYRLRLRRMESAVNAARVAAANREMPAGSGADMGTLAMIWPMLDTDPIMVTREYLRALTAGDQMTMDSIETMPAVHGGALSTAKLSELRTKRLKAEAPEKAALNLSRAQRASDLEFAYRAADQMLTGLERDLQAPDADTGRRDRDGLPIADLELVQ